MGHLRCVRNFPTPPSGGGLATIPSLLFFSVDFLDATQYNQNILIYLMKNADLIGEGNDVSKSKGKQCCGSRHDSGVSHQIEAIITIDERGQMVLPKETRTRAGIRAGDKLALVGWRKGDRVCCLSLVKVEEMTEMLGDLMDSLKAATSET